MNAIITVYPLSRDYQKRLDAVLHGHQIVIVLGSLRQMGFFRMVRYLISVKSEKIFIPIEDSSSYSLLPLIKIIAAIIRLGGVYLIQNDLQIFKVSRLNIFVSCLELIYASLISWLAARIAKYEIQKLLNCVRIAPIKSSDKKALYLNANLWFGVKAGGSVGHISGVVNALSECGYSVDFSSCGGRLLVDDRAKYLKLEPPRSFGLPYELNFYRFHFHVCRQLGNLFKLKRVDFIYQRLSMANYSGIVLSRRFRLPLVLEYNGSEAWIARNWGRPLREQALAEKCEEVNLRHAHLVVTISEVLRTDLIIRGVDPRRIVVYPNCIDPKMFNPTRFSGKQITYLRSQLNINVDSIVVTFVGTFGQWHGVEILAQAIRQLINFQQHLIISKKIHFMLVGDGVKMTEVRSILGEYSVDNIVTLTGLVLQEEAPLYLAASDILVSPHVPNPDGSPFFGSPTKLFEYMAMGKPIIASDLDQIGDVLRNSVRMDVNESVESISANKRVAVLVKPSDPCELANAIVFLAANFPVRSILGQNAQRLANNKYTWSSHVNQILAAAHTIDIL